MTTYRARGSLSRALLEKLHNDASLNEFDQSLWYKMSKELPVRYQSRFVAFEQPDETTLHWLDRAKTMSENLWLQLYHIFARFFLSMFMTQTDVNGILERGSMFILSEDQFVTLLLKGGVQFPAIDNNRPVLMLDIGAGDGEITERFRNSVERLMPDPVRGLNVFVTETSWIMRKRLEKYQNFTVIEVPDVRRELANLDLVTCFNVLDRCADPHQMLNDIYHILGPNGHAVFALVLPYSHYVETNTSHLPIRPLLPHWPTHNINMEGATCSDGDQCSSNHYSGGKRPGFEDEARIFFDQLELNGFKVEAWTKAPYLCEGDIRQSFYWLIDIVVVVSKVAAQ